MPTAQALRKNLSIHVAAGLLLATLATLPVEAHAASETICDRATLAATTFTDVSDTDVHKPHIVCAAGLDMVTPVSTEQFGSFTTVTRGEAAEFLARFIAKTVNPLTPTSDPVTFTDISTHPYETAIRLLAQHGITRGVTATQFAPDQPITRRQFARLLHATITALAITLPIDAATEFEDSRDPAIQALRNAQIASGHTNSRFEPTAMLRRGQAATLLTRAAVHAHTRQRWRITPTSSTGGPGPGPGPAPTNFTLAYATQALPSTAQTTTLSPTVSGATPTTYAVSGELPPGVTFDTATGEFTSRFSTGTALPLGLGSGVACMVLPDTTIRCTGTNDAALGDGTTQNRSRPVAVLTSGTALNNPVEFTGALKVETGGSHSCALLLDATVWCWGAGGSGTIGDGISSANYKPLNPRQVLAQGADPTANQLTDVSDLAVSASHNCALMQDSTVRCWGNGSGGALGDGTTSVRANPVVAIGVTNVSQLVAGSGFTCAVLADTTARCWGKNDRGQLGDGTTLNRTQAVTVLASGTTESNPVPLTGITRLAAQNTHVCAAVTTNTNQQDVMCWGAGTFGQLGHGQLADSLHPVRTLLPYDASGFARTITGLSVGSNHSCALLDHAGIRGEAWCWGYNDNSALLGIGTAPSTAESRHTPVPVLASGTLASNPVALTGAANLNGGSNFTCVTLGPKPYCWGRNHNGQPASQSASMGIGTSPAVARNPIEAFTGFLTAPTVTPAPDATGIAVGQFHACAILADSTVHCWGRNFAGQLGNNTLADTNTPIRVGGATTLRDATQVAAGEAHTCAVRTNGTVWCWGQNTNGQLGDGTQTNSLVPVQVAGITTATQISTGNNHSCAVLNDTTAQCWGSNTSGQLGNGTLTTSASPVTVLSSTAPDVPLAGITQISAGTGYTCAVLAAGEARCWGSNSDSRLGNGTATPSVLPTAVLASGTPDNNPVPLLNVDAIVAGAAHSCAVLADNTAWCWGSTSNIGRLGDGDASSVVKPHPVQVLTGDVNNPTPLTDAQAITTRSRHTCVLHTDQTVSCWGENVSGRLGDGTQTTRTIAVPVLFSGTADTNNAVTARAITAISAGGEHTCAMIQGSLKCWGIGSLGRLGNGANISSNYPVTVRSIGSTWTVIVTATDGNGNTASTTVSLTITG